MNCVGQAVAMRFEFDCGGFLWSFEPCMRVCVDFGKCREKIYIKKVMKFNYNLSLKSELARGQFDKDTAWRIVWKSINVRMQLSWIRKQNIGLRDATQITFYYERFLSSPNKPKKNNYLIFSFHSDHIRNANDMSSNRHSAYMLFITNKPQSTRVFLKPKI